MKEDDNLFYFDGAVKIYYLGSTFDMPGEGIILSFQCKNVKTGNNDIFMKIQVNDISDECRLCKIKGKRSSEAKYIIKPDLFDNKPEHIQRIMLDFEIDYLDTGETQESTTYFFRVNSDKKSLRISKVEPAYIDIDESNPVERQRRRAKKKRELIEAERRRKEEERILAEYERKEEEELKKWEKEHEQRKKLAWERFYHDSCDPNPTPLKPNRDKNGIFYFSSYYPQRRALKKGLDEYLESLRILSYKYGMAENDYDDLAHYTQLISRAIAYFVQILDWNLKGKGYPIALNSLKVNLVAVPASDKDEKSMVIHSIEAITKQCSYKAQVIDASNLLIREKSIRSAAKSGRNRPSYEESKNTIKVNGECFPDQMYVIIDDVTTTGTIMNVCQDLLVEHGASLGNICRLAIAKTMRW